ncbi:hypothetical protein LCGC14_2067960 [marine sediment metagenome]|uniref:Uncharacterized protein n=1 Tax=marine sediment metagenome TaxID=412755 RepID=A0A0F9GXR2_9ZZZZ
MRAMNGESLKDLNEAMKRVAAFQEEMEALGFKMKVSVSIDLTKNWEERAKPK